MAVAKPPYPREVRRSLAWGRRECRAQGGGAVAYGPGIVRTGDLTGDGRPDFVVDYREAACAGYLGMFNGTGGWDLEILVTGSKGRVVPVFSGRVRDYDLSDGPGPRTMTFDLHGAYCGLGGTDRCVKRRRMDARRFEYRDR
jgi:hypothetical protein